MSPEYSQIIIEQLKSDAVNKTAGEILELVAQYLENEVVIATSFGVEDQVILDIAARHRIKLQAITLDTGRLFPETYEVWDRTEKQYNLQIKAYYPQSKDLEELVNNQGINGFRNGIEQRKACCSVRKLEPLSRALSNQRAWVCGLRQDQAITRANVEPIEWDAQFNLIKVNPLYNWSEEDVWRYVKAYDVPYNTLHDQGYPSIGCAGCTRAITKVQTLRDGRWWWESPESKECGLHNRPRV